MHFWEWELVLREKQCWSSEAGDGGAAVGAAQHCARRDPALVPQLRQPLDQALHRRLHTAAGALLRFLARFLNMAVCSGFSCWAVCLRPLEITDQHHHKREMSRGDFSPIKCHERREVKRSREAQPLTRHQKIPLVPQVPNAQPCFTTSLPV